MAVSAARRLALALEWRASKDALDAAKAAEAALRTEVIDACFPAGLAEGTNTHELPRGFVLKVVSRALAKPGDVESLKTAIGKLAALGEVGKLLAGRLVKWKPEVSLSEFRKLDANVQQLFGKAVTVERTSPSMSLAAPD
jgi:hypothetical protein